MKNLFKLSALALTLAAGLIACQKDYDATPSVPKDVTQNPLKGTFSCLLNGDQFTAEVKSHNFNGDSKTLTLTGTKYSDTRETGVYQQVVITVPNYTGAGRFGITGAASITYIMTNAEGGMATYQSMSNENYYVQVEGTYKGAFNVVVANTTNSNDRVVLSQGKFEFE